MWNRRRLVATVMQGGAQLTYLEKLIQTYGASEVWPLVDIASGTTIKAAVAAARNGTLANWDLQNTAGPVAGTLAPYIEGVSGETGNIYSASHSSIFNGATGSLVAWAKKSSWATINNIIMVILIDGSNYIRVKADAANRLAWEYVAGGTAESRTLTSLTTTGWFMVGMSWDKTAGADGEVRAYYNGTQVGATMTGLGTWAGVLDTNSLVNIGNYLSSQQQWNGWLAYCAVKYGAVWTPAQMEAMYLAANPT